MNHLGERISTLVDGQLEGSAAVRAVSHLADCQECRQAVELERLTKLRLRALAEPLPDGDLVARLLQMAGPSGPLPPRPGHVPGSPRPQFASTAGLRPSGRRGSSRPMRVRRSATTNSVIRAVRASRTSRTRMAAAMVGAACLVGAGVAGGVAHGGVADQRRVAPSSVSSSLLPSHDQSVLWGSVSPGR